MSTFLCYISKRIQTLFCYIIRVAIKVGLVGGIFSYSLKVFVFLERTIYRRTLTQLSETLVTLDRSSDSTDSADCYSDSLGLAGGLRSPWSYQVGGPAECSFLSCPRPLLASIFDGLS